MKLILLIMIIILLSGCSFTIETKTTSQADFSKDCKKLGGEYFKNDDGTYSCITSWFDQNNDSNKLGD